MTITPLRTSALSLLASVGLLGACASEPTTDSGRAAMSSSVTSSLDEFTSRDPSLAGLLDRSAGYAVFPDVGKAGFIAGGAYGRGEVFEHGRHIGYADVTKGSIGLQAGAQTFGELVVFLNQTQLDDFKDGEFAFSADLSAVAIKPGAARAVDYSKGVVVFVNPKGGLMAEASLGGQNFRYTPASRTASYDNHDMPRYGEDSRYRSMDDANATYGGSTSRDYSRDTANDTPPHRDDDAPQSPPR